LYLPVDENLMSGFETISGVTYIGMAEHNGLPCAKLELLSGGYEFDCTGATVTVSLANGYIQNGEKSERKLEKLAELIAQAQSLHETDYTAESWVIMQDAFSVAQFVMNNASASPSEISNAENALKDAIDALVIAETAPGIVVKAVTAGNGKAMLELSLVNPNGQGYTVYISDTENGVYTPYTDVTFNAIGVFIKGLENDKVYYVYITYQENGQVIAQSIPVKVVPCK
jgi:hypothetical protein